MNKEASELGSYTTAERRAGENHRNFFFFNESVAQKEQSGRRRGGKNFWTQLKRLEIHIFSTLPLSPGIQIRRAGAHQV